MGKADNESTTKFKVDISELKSGMTEARRHIKLANAEFKAATAGMDDWASSADGVSAKIKQLNTTLDNEKKQLSLLEQQLELVEKAEGENSKGAEELKIKILNQKAAVAKTEKTLEDYSTRLEEIKDESKKAADGIDDITEAAKEAGKTADDIEDVKNATEKAGDAAEKSSNEGFTTLKGTLANLYAEGIKKVVDGLKEIATMTSSSSTLFQQQTGKSEQEMEAFNEQIEKLYANNYGESMNDVAEAMAAVSNSTKETEPEKIAELTQNALELRDVYGFEVTETMRAVNMLMDQFGISGDKAFNLIIQGAQKGLDKNGDLLDTINEYSVHYKQQGYSAEQFFNSLVNGADSGTFSVDKLGDAMKEFGIRTKDTASSTTEGFELIGLNADTIREKFSNGGESAQEATQEVLEALFSMDDKVKQNQAGVDLFGTMWEDLGIDGVKALMDVNGEIDSTKDSMQELLDIKSDDLETQIQTLGRTIQTEIFVPVVKELMPDVKKGVKWVSENLDTVKKVIKGVGSAIVVAFADKQVASFASGVKTVITTVTTLSSTLTSPMGVIAAVTGVISGLVAAVQIYNQQQWSNSEAGKFASEIEGIKSKIETNTQGIVDNLSHTLENLDNIYADNTLIDEYQAKLEELLSKAELTPEEQAQLQTIVTYFENNVDGFSEVWNKYTKKSEDGTYELQEDLKTVQKEINNTIDEYQKLTNMSALSSLSTENSTAQISARTNLSSAREEISQKQKEVDKEYSNFKLLFNQAHKGESEESTNATWNRITSSNKMVTTNEAWGEAWNNYLSMSNELEGLKSTYNEQVAEMNRLIMTGDDLTDVQKVLNGDYSDAAAVMMAYNAGMISMNDVQKSQWKSLNNLRVAAKNTGKNIVIGLVEGTNEYKGALITNSNGLANTVLSEYNRTMGINSPAKEMYKRGVYTVQGLILSISDEEDDLIKQVRNMASSLTDELDSSLSVDPFADLKSQKLNLGNIPRARAAIGAATSVSTTNSIINNNNSSTNKTFVQNNYSPKALSRLDIYRQTKTLFKAAERT